MIAFPSTAPREIPRQSPPPSGNPYAGYLPLPSLSARSVGVDPALERALSVTVAGIRVQALSLSGMASLQLFGMSEGAVPVQVPLGERVPRFYDRLAANVDGVTAAWGMLQAPRTATTLPGAEYIQVIAFRVPGTTPAALVDAWLDATSASVDISLTGGTIGAHTVAVAVLGDGHVETMYAADQVLYVAFSLGVPDNATFNTYIAGLIAALP